MAEPSRRLYFGGLAPQTTKEHIKDLLGSKYSERIVEITILRGFGFVEVDDVQDAKEIVRTFNDEMLNDQRLNVQYAKPRGAERESRFGRGPPRGGGYRLVARNIGSDISWQDLKDFGRQCGRVTFADVDRSGDGVLEYSDPRDMEDALRTLDNTELKGTVVRLQEERGGRDDYRSSRRSPPYRSRRRSPSPYGARGSRRGDSRSPPYRRGGRDRSGSPPRRRRPSPPARGRDDYDEPRASSRASDGYASPKQDGGSGGDW